MTTLSVELTVLLRTLLIKVSASVSYAVASGVTAILGYSNVDSQNEGSADTKDGSAWYIGANMSF